MKYFLGLGLLTLFNCRQVSGFGCENLADGSGSGGSGATGASMMNSATTGPGGALPLCEEDFTSDSFVPCLAAVNDLSADLTRNSLPPGSIIVRPDGLTGWGWDDLSAFSLRTVEPIPLPAIAVTCVIPRVINSDGWPTHFRNFAGLLIRSSGSANNDWLNFAVGRIADGEKGYHVARKLMSCPDTQCDIPSFDELVTNPNPPPPTGLAVCLSKTGEYLLYRNDNDSWEPLNVELVGGLEVPLMSTIRAEITVFADNPSNDIEAEFQFFKVGSIASGTPADCESVLLRPEFNCPE
jgi:hypothetical protein